MKIGILLCDQVDSNMTHRFGDYGPQFDTFLNRQGKTDIDCLEFDVRKNSYPADAEKFDGFLITGSRHGVYDKLDWIDTLRKFIRTSHAKKIKILGICFGHQILADALGGKVVKHQVGFRMGVVEYRVKVPDKIWMKPAAPVFNICTSCQDQVVELPPGAVSFCENEFVTFGGYTLGDNILSFQGHPEMSKDYNSYLIDKKKEQGLFDDAKATGFHQTLKNEIDDKLVSEWAVRFFSKN